MAQGAGKYDDACTAARVATGGEAVVLIVVNGTSGSGFSVQTINPHFAAALPSILRNVADQIEREVKA